ncbi:MAG: hypothetical protein WCO93_02760 [bacterium]
MMKRNIKIYLLLLAGFFGLLLPASVQSQEKSDSAATVHESKMALNYLCTSNDTVVLTANLFIRKDMDVFELQNASVTFFASAGSDIKTLGKVITNEEGNAVLTIPLVQMPADKDGLISYTAKFDGTNKYSPSEASFSAKPAKIKLSFSIQDSLRIVKIDATQKNEKLEDVPLGKETVFLYVPRLFSLLKVGEVSLDENGSGTLEFPNDIIGDTLGNLNLLARIEESERFGFVQGQFQINWGVPKQYYKAEVPSRELWTPVAPMWMIITLIIMLAGVWAHYFYAIYELVMIKLHHKKDQPKL